MVEMRLESENFSPESATILHFEQQATEIFHSIYIYTQLHPALQKILYGGGLRDDSVANVLASQVQIIDFDSMLPAYAEHHTGSSALSDPLYCN